MPPPLVATPSLRAWWIANNKLTFIDKIIDHFGFSVATGVVFNFSSTSLIVFLNSKTPITPRHEFTLGLWQKICLRPLGKNPGGAHDYDQRAASFTKACTTASWRGTVHCVVFMLAAVCECRNQHQSMPRAVAIDRGTLSANKTTLSLRHQATCMRSTCDTSVQHVPRTLPDIILFMTYGHRATLTRPFMS